MHYRMAKMKEEKAETDYLKHKQKASTITKQEIYVEHYFKKPTLV